MIKLCDGVIDKSPFGIGKRGYMLENDVLCRVVGDNAFADDCSGECIDISKYEVLLKICNAFLIFGGPEPLCVRIPTNTLNFRINVIETGLLPRKKGLWRNFKFVTPNVNCLKRLRIEFMMM